MMIAGLADCSFILKAIIQRGPVPLTLAQR